jgi:hypothetical protein
MFTNDFTEYDPSAQSFMMPYGGDYDSSVYLSDQNTMQFHSMHLPTELYADPSYIAQCRPILRTATPSDEPPSPVSPARPYTALSGGEMSSGSAPSSLHSRSSGSRSPPFPSTVPRSHRYNPLPGVIVRKPVRRRSIKQDDSDDEFDVDGADEYADTLAPNGVSGGTEYRRETVRKQRIESEQRRRDELRDGYKRLKEALPASNQKASKAALLDRATIHVQYLENFTAQLQAKLQKAETEVSRLHRVNEALMLGTAEQRHAAAAAAAKLAF